MGARRVPTPTNRRATTSTTTTTGCLLGLIGRAPHGHLQVRQLANEVASLFRNVVQLTVKLRESVISQVARLPLQ